ncbi:unnamed protein product, partial [Staurois parvus]
MVPLLLLDHGVSPADLGIWNGILALMASIVGSALGGMVVSKGRSIKSLLGTVLSLRLSCLVLQTFLLSALGRDTSLVKGQSLQPPVLLGGPGEGLLQRSVWDHRGLSRSFRIVLGVHRSVLPAPPAPPEPSTDFIL